MIMFDRYIRVLYWLTVIGYLLSDDVDSKYHSERIGKYQIQWNSGQPHLEIHSIDCRTPSKDKTNEKCRKKLLFRTLEHWPFLTVGYAASFRHGGPIVDGNYKPDEWTLFETPYQSIISSDRLYDSILHEESLILGGEVWGLVTRASYEIIFSLPRDEAKILPNQLQIHIKVTPILGKINKLFLNYWCDPQEKFYGFGTQFTHFNMKGHRIPIIVAEQGIGRGAQPTTFILNMLADGAGGDSKSTYAPKPLYVTNFYRSLVVMNSDMMYFDLRDDDSVVIEISSLELTIRLLNGHSMPQLVTEISTITGTMSPLPKWTQEGAIIGLEGGTKEVQKIVEKLTQEKYKLPISGIWLQDWVGLRNAYDGDRLLWNWRLDSNYYHDWNTMIRSWSELGIRVLTYINPFFSFIPSSSELSENISSDRKGKVIESNPHHISRPRNNETEAAINHDSHHMAVASDRQSSKLRDIYTEGLENRYFLYSQDDSRHPYILRSGSIEFHMLDFTNPQARRWMKDIIKYEMISNSLSSGWMADFAEYAPFDVALHDPSDFLSTDESSNELSSSTSYGARHHNEYPQQWAKLNHEAVLEAKEERLFERVNYTVKDVRYAPLCKSCDTSNKDASSPSSEWAYFLRSGWLQSPRYASLFWLGDQLVSWDTHDGIKSAVVGMLTSGLGGHSLTHTDIGGYTMQERGPYPYIRTKELLFRWIELSAFGSALFRTHVGSSCNPINKQIYDDDESIQFFSKFATIFSFLRCYRGHLMEEAYLYGYPLIRPMSFHIPNQEDKEAHPLTDQDTNGSEDEELLTSKPDDPTWDITTQYYFGSDFLISPVLDPLESESIWPYSKLESIHRNKFKSKDLRHSFVQVYVPCDVPWIHLWTGERVFASDCYNHDGNSPLGQYLRVSSPVGYPPVFYREDSVDGQSLREFIKLNDWDAESTWKSENNMKISSPSPKPRIIFQWIPSKYEEGTVFTAADWAVWLGLIPSTYSTSSSYSIHSSAHDLHGSIEKSESILSKGFDVVYSTLTSVSHEEASSQHSKVSSETVSILDIDIADSSSASVCYANTCSVL